MMISVPACSKAARISSGGSASVMSVPIGVKSQTRTKERRPNLLLSHNTVTASARWMKAPFTSASAGA